MEKLRFSQFKTIARQQKNQGKICIAQTRLDGLIDIVEIVEPGAKKKPSTKKTVNEEKPQTEKK